MYRPSDWSISCIMLLFFQIFHNHKRGIDKKGHWNCESFEQQTGFLQNRKGHWASSITLVCKHLEGRDLDMRPETRTFSHLWALVHSTNESNTDSWLITENNVDPPAKHCPGRLTYQWLHQTEATEHEWLNSEWAWSRAHSTQHFDTVTVLGLHNISTHHHEVML